MTSPQISVVVPAYNGAAFIADAIASVRAQDCGSTEIIVVDDGSTDATAEIVQRIMPAVRLLRQSKAGAPAARNAGIAAAQADVVALLDCDDLWPSDKLILQLPWLAPWSHFDLVLGKTQMFRTRPEASGEAVDEAPPFFVTQLGCALFRRSVFERVGRFDETLRYGEDVDFLLRAREAGLRAKFVDAITIRYRRHDASLTRTPGHSSLGLAAHLKRSIDRRRGGTGEVAPLAAWFAGLPRGGDSADGNTKTEDQR